MKRYGTNYLLGMFCLLLGERLLSGDSSMRMTFDAIGGVLLLVALGETFKLSKNNSVYRNALIFCGLGITSIFVYCLSLDPFVDLIGLEDKAAHQFSVVISVLWPIIWICGTLPLIALWVVSASGQRHMHAKRANIHSAHWLTVAFAISSVFVLNYVAHKTNVRWDATYFKTTEPGSSTKNLVANLAQPIAVHLFFSSSSEVQEEVRGYFDALQSENLNVSYIDHGREPELAKELKVRNNGYIVLTVGEDEERQSKTINIGEDFERAKRNLKKLDSLVREKLLSLSKGPQKIYITTGHGELYWKSAENKNPLRNISFLKSLLKKKNFSLKELSVVTNIPEDAAMILILAPQEDFLEVELEVLNEYREKGGSILVALEPGGVKMKELLDPLGISFDETAYLSNSNKNYHYALTKGPADVRNILTNKYTTHPAVSTMAKYGKAYASLFFQSGVLTKTKESKATAILRSMEKTFDDRNNNFAFDKEGEKEDIWDLGYAWSNKTEESESRIIVTADSTWLSDAVLKGNRVHQVLVEDIHNWLLNDSTSSGNVNDEQDVALLHSKGTQGSIFYGTILLIPLGLFVLGSTYVRNRKRKGEKA